MNFRVLLLLVIPHTAFADVHLCNTIDPNKEPAQSIAACTELLATNSLQTLGQAEVLERRGIAFRELGEFDKSIQDIGASLALSNNTSTMRMLAWTYREVGRYTDAEQLYTRVLEQDTHSQGWLSRCVVRQDMERYEKALSDCKEALRQNSEDLDALYFTARAYSYLDRPKEALPLTKTAMTLAPGDPRHLVEHVWALHQLGRTSDARKKALKGLDYFPADPNLSSFLNENR
jgi:tetratricopeptide (TPR) repeat protein